MRKETKQKKKKQNEKKGKETKRNEKYESLSVSLQEKYITPKML